MIKAIGKNRAPGAGADSRAVRLRPRRGFALPAVMVFMVTALGLWVLLHRHSGSAMRIERIRDARAQSAYWSAHALAQALALLETGTPPKEPYECLLPISDGNEVRYFRLTYEKLNGKNWQVDVEASSLDSGLPIAPIIF